jgi:CheY-like chemotaxis protein
MESEQRRHVRIAGPFDGYRVGLIDSPVTIYDLSEGGCFVNWVTSAPEVGRALILKIEIPEEGWVCLKSQVMYSKPAFGFAVSFVEVPHEAADRLRRGILRRRGLPPGAEAISSEMPIDDAGSVADPLGVKQILVADDDFGVRALIKKALSTYRVQTARDVAEAVALGRRAPVDLLITDYLMPDGTGAELIGKLREGQPSLKALVITGHASMLDEQGYDWWVKERRLGKPFTVGALRDAVTELIGSP